MAFIKLLTGVLACSLAVIWIKLSSLDPILMTALRLVIAVAILSPFVYRDWRKHRADLSWGHLRDAAIPGVMFALHIITWNIGIRLTDAANGTLIVNLNPIVTPFLLLAFLGERVTRREVTATLFGVIGVLVLCVADFQLSAENFQGDLICFGSMLLMAVYLTLGRKFRHHPTTLLYVTPLYATASLIAFAAAPLAEPLGLLVTTEPLDWWYESKWLLLLAIFPTIIGHSLINNAMRTLRGQVVSVMVMMQFVLASIVAWFVLGEVPAWSFYVAAVLVVTAGLIAAGVISPFEKNLAEPDPEPA